MEKPKPKLFISHRSQDNDVCLAIAKAFEERFDILLDCKGLVAGDNWQREIETWMGECHAALVVVSKHLGDAPWVPDEAFLLSWRMNYMPGSVRLVPVLLDGLDPAVLRDPVLATSNLHTLQAARVASPGHDVAEIEAILGPLAIEFQAATGFLEVERLLANRFRLAGPEAIETAAEHLELGSRRLAYARDAARWIARALLRADFDHLESVLTKAAPYLRKGPAKDVWDATIPFHVVGADIAKRVGDSVRAEAPRPSVALTTARPESVKIVARRASALVPPWPIFDSASSDSDRNALRDNVARTLAEAVKLDPLTGPVTPEFVAEVREHLTSYVKKRGAVLVILPRKFEDQPASTLAELASDFPLVTFVIRTESPSPDLAVKFANVVVVPALDPAVEKRVDRAWRSLESDVLSNYP